MTRWLRFPVLEEGARYWYEPDDEGRARRQVVFERSLPVPRAGHPPAEVAGSPDGGASVAASRAGLALVRERFGARGVRFRETVYGVLTDGRVRVPGDAEDVGEAALARAWDSARRQRRFTRHRTGPLPEGTVVTGTVTALPWGPGRTGPVVDAGRPGRGFVDLGGLPPRTEDWPPVGTVTEFEVVALRIDTSGGRADLEVRLRPTATPPPGGPWPRRGPR
ncbi:hypothetical protein [Streptomyces sp. Tu 3180]|uniref:hypothetical protein n=1 Tax=Streptomyces sp. Tu 3180 TaxID=2682611 RepID=UPI0013573F2F|nr:hypothetical protein [Streptomyces sp. Tu 3180]KAF3468379.1 hypothetical protein GL259_31560 [Streptomyces sp. Tu 3180]